MIVNKYSGNGGGGGGSYTLPTATANRLGGIKVGSGLTVQNDGTLSTSGSTYELPVASDQVLGGVKVGSGLTIDAAGVLSTSGGTAPSGEGNVKVYMYSELYSGDTYDHYDLSVPNEMEALAKSGTPVYILYTGPNKSVYLELTTYTGNSLVFYGADGTQYFHCTLVKDSPWTMSEMGHSRNGDYEAVSQLPQRAQEGQLFYVKPYIDTVPYPGYAITATTEEGYVAHIYDPENNEAAIYRSGTDFYWDYYNDGGMHKSEDKDFYYKTDNENGVFYVYLPNSSWTITLEEGSTSASTDPYNVEIAHDAETYRYQNSGFTRAEGYDDIVIYLDWGRAEESYDYKQEIRNKVLSVSNENRKNIRLIVNNIQNDKIPFGGDEPVCFEFVPYYIGNGNDIRLSCAVFPWHGGGAYDSPVFITIQVGGDMVMDVTNVPVLIYLELDPASHYLQPMKNESWMFVKRTSENTDRCVANFIIKYNGRFYNATYSPNYIYFDARVDEMNVHGKWILYDEGSDLVEWTEEADKYQVVSGLSNAGVNVASWDGYNSRYSIPASVITNLTAETDLLTAVFDNTTMKVTTDGTNLNIYAAHYDDTLVYATGGTWEDSEIRYENDEYYNPTITNISTGSSYSFEVVFSGYGPAVGASVVKVVEPFEGLMAFDTTNSSLNLYASGQWNVLFPIVP